MAREGAATGMARVVIVNPRRTGAVAGAAMKAPAGCTMR